jgi:transposase
MTKLELAKEPPNAQSFSPQHLTELRHHAVRQVQRGESPEVVARQLGIHRGTLYIWLAKHRNGGWDALEAKNRGGPAGQAEC